MNMGTLRKFTRLVGEVHNPLPLLRDWMERADAPYTLVLRDGIRMELRPGRGDLDSFRAVWLSQAYLGPGERLRPGDTVVDVGANIGCFTLLAARWVGPAGRIVAVEPDAETFSRLERNIALSRLENVVAVRAAVAGEEGTVELHSPSVCAYASVFPQVDGRHNDGTVQQVPAMTLAQVFEQNGIDCCHFLKLDCEGAEHEVVRTLSPETAGRIQRIGMELHEVEGCDSDALIHRLHAFGLSRLERAGAILRFQRRAPA